MALEHHYLGVIFLYPPDNDAAYANANTRIPIVTICDRSSHVTGDIVELNNFEAGALAARHLLELGHKNIAVLSSTSVRSTTSRATRVAGVLSEVRKVLSEDHLLILSGNSGSTDMLQEKSSHYQMGHTLAQNKKIFQRNITGLICVNDLVAYGAMDALISRGYRFQEDFSVIGSDNLLFSSMPQVSLTTIRSTTPTSSRSPRSRRFLNRHAHVRYEPERLGRRRAFRCSVSRTWLSAARPAPRAPGCCPACPAPGSDKR